jgi:hypothetical protein
MRASLEHTAERRDDVTHDGIDPLLAVQLSDRPRYDTWPGETRLALAVLEDAITTVRMTTGVRTARAQRLAAEAWAWLASRDTTHPFAFENLCDYLGLSAAWLRSGLRGTAVSTPATPRGGRAARSSARESARRGRARGR